MWLVTATHKPPQEKISISHTKTHTEWHLWTHKTYKFDKCRNRLSTYQHHTNAHVTVKSNKTYKFDSLLSVYNKIALKRVTAAIPLLCLSHEKILPTLPLLSGVLFLFEFSMVVSSEHVWRLRARVCMSVHISRYGKFWLCAFCSESHIWCSLKTPRAQTITRLARRAVGGWLHVHMAALLWKIFI